MSHTDPIRPRLPAISEYNRAYWDGGVHNELRLPHCRNCGHLWLPPSPRCPRCLQGDIDTVTASGRARLWSWVVMHRQYFKEFPPPYIVAFVELEEGPMLMTTIVGASAGELTCDAALEAVFEPATPEMAILKFRLVKI